jgi:ABC-type nickel/cobalt efflux system permease component RcnA
MMARATGAGSDGRAFGGGVSETWAVLSILGLGFVIGLRHATEADHIAAIGSMIGDPGGARRALRTGVLWGTGHTVSILAAGFLVLGLRMAISERTSRFLEGGVALMIITLGGAALSRALRGRTDAHRHTHTHGGYSHTHLHFHGADEPHLPSDPGHAVPVGIKPLLVGVMHGLAGSAALTLLVLTQTRSVILGLAYLTAFGAGSIGGMALMSVLISVPFHATAERPALNRSVRIVAGGLGLAFGLFYAWSQVRPGA